MKKIFLIIKIFFIIICTSLSYATNISQRNDLNIIINSKKISLNLPIISYNDYTLIPAQNILPFFNVEKTNFYYSNKTIILKRYSSILTLYINDINGYIDGNKIQLPVSPLIYKDNIYIPLRVISDFYDCYIHYDNNSKTIFIKDLNEYQQIESFFKKVERKLTSVNSIQIDIINELKNQTSSYAFGNSFCINKASNTIFEKNVLEANWRESNKKINYNSNNFFNNNFFIGLSFDRTKSSESQMVFYGFYPTKSNILCESTFYIDTNTLYITKQISEFTLDNLQVKQSTLYTYT